MFNAIQIDKTDDQQTAAVVQLEPSQLPELQVLVKVDYSTINYKDALALSGAAPIIRQFPLVPGIDLAGTVEASEDSRWQVGDRVVLNGWGVGESHSGGLGQYARVSGDWLVKLPETISTREAMCIGTAGYTAALCVDALYAHGLTPESGDVLVTGASGGVGSVAIALLATRGFQIVTSTGKTAETGYLQGLGASELIDRTTLSEPGKPLQKERWAGVVDAVGGNTLANACAQTRYRGAVAACGLAESAKFNSTVMPFILRGVTLYGIDSVMAPGDVRAAAWSRLAEDLDKTKLESMITEVALADSIGLAGDVLAGKIRGRLLVNVNA